MPSHFKRHSAGHFNMADRFGRNFLLLQGPHGPFFSQLGTLVEQTGATAWRVGFNDGDAFFLAQQSPFHRPCRRSRGFAGRAQHDHCGESITDIVLYGDTRPIHAEAIKLAKPICGAKTCPTKTVTGLALQTCFKAGDANLDGYLGQFCALR